jgi:hypothetical protein
VGSIRLVGSEKNEFLEPTLIVYSDIITNITQELAEGIQLGSILFWRK